MDSRNLTVLIPTYNRKEGLIKLLRSLETQGHYDSYKILISDNHSNYDIHGSLKESLSSDFLCIIRVNSWSFNTEMATNISIPFLLVDTEWCWMISDDDTIVDGALETILSEIEKNPDVLAIKNSITGFLPHRDCRIHNIKEFVDYYSEDGRNGELIYLSMVYNLKNLQPYLSKLTEYSHTYVSFLIPIMFGVIDGKSILFSSIQAIDYNNDASDNWSQKRYVKVALGIRSFIDIEFPCDFYYIEKFYKVLIRNIGLGKCTYSIMQCKSKNYRRTLWNTLSPMFKNTTIWYKRLFISLIFNFYQITGYNALNVLNRY